MPVALVDVQLPLIQLGADAGGRLQTGRGSGRGMVDSKRTHIEHYKAACAAPPRPAPAASAQPPSPTCSTVVREPRRIVPPLWVVEISGMNTTAGLGVAGANSVLFASLRPSTLRANSMTAICEAARTGQRQV